MQAGCKTLQSHVPSRSIGMCVVRFLCTVSIVPLFLIGCEDPRSGAEDRTSVASTAAWSYEGPTGPDQWATLSDAYAACDGAEQSPINLAEAEAPDAPTTLSTSYSTQPGEVVDTGHAIQVNTTGGELTIDGTSYELRQFHVHTPSEHTVNGTGYAAEIHLVHTAGDQQLAVLGILVEEGPEDHPALEDWSEGRDTTLAVNAGRLLPDRQSYYTYDGSLTTPPCREIVRWIVMDHPIQISKGQLTTLRAQHDGNARPVHPLSDRRLVYVGP